MEYQVLTKSLRFSQLENELQFKIIPTPGVFRNKYVQDDYASSSEYGMMTHDDDNALVHAFGYTYVHAACPLPRQSRCW